MNDYSELIKVLKIRSENNRDGNFWNEGVADDIDRAISAIEQLSEERETDTEIIKGLNKDLAEASRYRDYLGRKYGDCASCCVPACPKRSSLCDGAPCGNWESYEEFCIENKEVN